MGIPSHITLAIWVRVRVRVTGDAHITRILGMGMPKTLGCPHHCDSCHSDLVEEYPGSQVGTSKTVVDFRIVAVDSGLQVN